MLASWTYRCRGCDKVFDHTSIAPVPTTVACSCGAQAGWTYTKANGIHATHSGRKYGEFDPQFGCVVESYSHKKKLMKERGWEELPPETKEEIAEDTVGGTTATRDPAVVMADSPEELAMMMHQHGEINMRHTGEASLRRPPMESMTPFKE
mgnify:CR=1 FL=1|tara:strand:+ start:1249 stop:1701 length:453 start_codon:yes stop_codon:yes gene_type:complete